MAEEPKERKAFEAHMRVGGHSNHDKHPDGSYVSSAMELWWQGLKALGQLPSQGGEAVEVVASIAVDAEGVVRDFTLEPGLDRHPGGYTVTPLMTVAQHQRILAAAVPAGCKVVPVERIAIALEAVQNAMADAYNNAYQDCCGRGQGECCGNPIAAWSDADKAIMDALAPAQRELSALLASAEGVKDE